MNEQEAFYAWLSSFKVPAYAEGSIPTNATLPYMTFSWAKAATFDTVGITVTAYARTRSQKKITNVCENVAKSLSHGGVTLKCENGLLWLTSGSPQMQFFNLEEGLKGCHININMQFLTL